MFTILLAAQLDQVCMRTWSETEMSKQLIPKTCVLDLRDSE